MIERETLRLSQALTELAKVYKEEWSDISLKAIYYRVLGELPLESVLAACDAWLTSDSPFFPKPGQLRVLAENLPANPYSTATLHARAEQAWQNLRGTARSHAYNRWALADGVTAQVFQVLGGGFMTPAGFGQWDMKYEEVKHREFVNTYIDLARQYKDLAPLPTEADARALMASRSYENTNSRDDMPSPDEVHVFVAALLNALEKKLSFPGPRAYKHGAPEYKPGSLEYTPSLSPIELDARKALLYQQGMTVLALELAQKGPPVPAA